MVRSTRGGAWTPENCRCDSETKNCHQWHADADAYENRHHLDEEQFERELIRRAWARNADGTWMPPQPDASIRLLRTHKFHFTLNRSIPQHSSGALSRPRWAVESSAKV